MTLAVDSLSKIESQKAATELISAKRIIAIASVVPVNSQASFQSSRLHASP